MDPTQIKKIQAMNRYKRPYFHDNVYFYSFTALACSLFCCVTLSLPYLSSMFREYLSSLIPILLSSKLLFIICNLIIIALMRNSKILSSDSSSTSHVYYDEYIQSTQTHHIPTFEVNKDNKTFQKYVDVVGERSMDMTAWGDGLMNTVDWKSKKTTETKEEDNLYEGDGQTSLVASSEELNKRADDFIARVNRHRRLELTLLKYGSY